MECIYAGGTNNKRATRAVCFLFPEDLKITEGRRSENSMAVVESYYGSGTWSQCGNSRAEPGEDMPQKTSEDESENQISGRSGVPIPSLTSTQVLNISLDPQFPGKSDWMEPQTSKMGQSSIEYENAHITLGAMFSTY
ncbi:uncharacterized protein LOC103878020 [Papio anubis]|uniref:uncharacterized protein LOC103878020 n=1 Tax=Papio anubis TaxID=9555 RepID=UPI0012ADFBFC|nr:uncharacterized protein LOC103878020 [Papio anubis]